MGTQGAFLNSDELVRWATHFPDAAQLSCYGILSTQASVLRKWSPVMASQGVGGGSYTL